MVTFDPRVDIYIEKAAPFAQPVLKHLRALVHSTCPETVETIKWGFPHFEYRGANLCSMASFKKHCTFSFWKATLLDDSKKILNKIGKTAMGELGRIEKLGDLPEDGLLTELIRQAMKLNEDGIAVPSGSRKNTNAELEIPDYFTEALNQNKKALHTFKSFSPSHKKEYLIWITEAKTEGTRNKRLATAIEWMEEGKVKNWKYIK